MPELLEAKRCGECSNRTYLRGQLLVWNMNIDQYDVKKLCEIVDALCVYRQRYKSL